jgi:hypothetical protein
MGNVTSINSKRPAGTERRSRKSNPDEVFYCSGIVLFAVALPFALETYGGWQALAGMAAIAAAGTVWGWVRFYRPRAIAVSCVPDIERPADPPNEDQQYRKAA